MDTTRLSSKGQVIIPKSVRNARHWDAGLELVVIDTDEGVLLKPKAPFAATELADVAGMFKGEIKPKTDDEIQAVIVRDLRRKWRASR